MIDSVQYEELCRRFIADKVGLPLDAVASVTIPNPQRPGLPKYKHQIDLYWETGNEVALYLNIANAKWRGTEKIDQGDVMLLQQVRQDVAAHKAFMITSVGFTAGAIAAAKDKGIALHVVAPEFDTASLPHGDRDAIQQGLEQAAEGADKPIYSHRIENRGLGFIDKRPGQVAAPKKLGGQSSRSPKTRVVTPSANNAASPATNRAVGGLSNRGNPSPGTRGSGGGRNRRG